MRNRLATTISAAALVALAPPAHAATLHTRLVTGRSTASTPHSSGPLSSRLATLAKPSVRSASPAARARRLSLPASGPGSLQRTGDDVLVDVRAATTSPGQLDALRAAGARVIAVARTYRTVTVAVAPDHLEAIAAVHGVESVHEDLAPMRSAAGGTSASTCPVGKATSEADTQMQVAAARAANGVTGAGVKVGAISDSYNTRTIAATHAAQDVANGDLPGTGNTCGNATPVDVVAEGPFGGEDEGRAMLQTVHDLAPGANLAFATAFPSEVDFLDAVDGLRAAHTQVITDDITFFDEPYFQDGPLSVAAADAVSHGIPYFSSAANDNFIAPDGVDRGSWEAPGFRAIGCPTLPRPETSCMNFGTASDPGNELPFLLAPGGELKLDLQWAEPWFGVRTDLDAFLVDDLGNVLASSTDNNGVSEQPFEFVDFANPSNSAEDLVWLVIGNRNGTTGPRLKYTMVQPQFQLDDVVHSVAPGDITGPSIYGHNGLGLGMSVAARPFDTSVLVEPYSSRGPVTHYFGPVVNTSPAARLSRPEVLAKPDVTATDCAQTSFFGDPDGSIFRFCGTSEAAPQAAAVAALEMQAAPAATAEQVMNVQKDTASRAVGLTTLAQGAGMVNALAAVNAVKRVGRAPTVVTGAAAGITTTAARLAGSINPQAFNAAYRFQYGRTTEYGAATPIVPVGFGLAPVAAVGVLGGLAPGSTYHFRLLALHNGVTVAAGADQVFRTVAVPRPPARMAVAATRRQHLSSKAVVLRLTCSQPCSGQVTARLKIRGRRGTIRLKAVRVSLAAGQTKRVKVRLSRSAVAAVRGALRRHKRVTASVSARLKSGTAVKTLRKTIVIIR